ncbi:ATP-binding cassette domain-containing protein [Halanaerobium sp. ST460_2HS_T2]|uniref:ATP-binding cassette domain-containing protein n=1 Tax=Halanaerobium sp. ST460_2HS_T2 TaxID=2183914 RepID=UPI000DF2F696|nr:ATP-binding cassette domain-containing protein [Halanaerobium sp. ST460_2HS_T2]RCW55349.1 ABC transporter family protein [Halanaerobium sp. ST460_2HS_T2]
MLVTYVEKKEFTANENEIEPDIQLLIEDLNIVTPSIEAKIKNLSGGNKQKAILARWMLAEMDLLLVNEPTRGIDVSAKTEIYKLLYKLNKEGVGIIVVSSELPELLTISDRIIVLYEGQLSGHFEIEEANREKLLKTMCTLDPDGVGCNI